jgi:hypothetical protein
MEANSMSENGKKYRIRRDAADYLTEKFGAPISEGTLAKLAVRGGGPPYRMAGHVAIYEQDDLDAFGNARMGPKVLSSSDVNRGPKPKGRPPKKIAAAPVETEQSRKRAARKVEPVE